MFFSGALAVTGIIWAKYSMVVIPKNYNLLFVNVFVASTGIYQLSRIFNHRKSNSFDSKQFVGWMRGQTEEKIKTIHNHFCICSVIPEWDYFPITAY